MRSPNRLDLILLLGVFALSLALRVGFTLGFDGLYGQDPYAYYNYGQILRQSLRQGQTLPAFFWPLGYPALLTIGFTIFGQSALTAQAISLFLGALLAPMAYVLARQIGAKSSGALTAALILAICGQAIQSSFVVMADIPALFWALLSAILLLHYLHNLQPRWLFLVALTLAIACVTRWLYLALIPVWGAALLLTWRGLHWREIFIAAITAALILLPQAAVSIRSPYPVLDHAWVEGWSPANYISHEFNNVDGHFVYNQINALFYAHPYYDSYFLAPIFTPFILIGPWVLRRKRISLLILLAWALLPYLFLAGIPYQNIRFPLIVMPTVAILAGFGLQTLFNRRLIPIYAVLLIVGLALMISTEKPMLAGFVANQTRDKTSVQWALQTIPAGARLYTFELTEPLKAYSSFDVHELYSETPDTLTAEFDNPEASYLYINVWTIENQWQGRELQTTYHWLRDTVGLEYLDRSGNYLLFRIENEDWHPTAGVQQPPK
jgi:4-amino-4-deoxy-L-arabinose transferase-like glycosyltransferase